MASATVVQFSMAFMASVTSVVASVVTAPNHKLVHITGPLKASLLKISSIQHGRNRVATEQQLHHSPLAWCEASDYRL